MSDKYILIHKVAIPEDDLHKWGEWMEHISIEEKRIDRTIIGDDKIVISTVFLGLDHSWNDGPPLLFETMVFGGPLEDEQTRCSTWPQAEEMHKKMVRKVKLAEKNNE